jgi:hypothetical protein
MSKAVKILSGRQLRYHGSPKEEEIAFIFKG